MQICGMLAATGLLALSRASPLAQQVTGVPGSSSATTSIDGKQLPQAAMQDKAKSD